MSNKIKIVNKFLNNYQKHAVTLCKINVDKSIS